LKENRSEKNDNSSRHSHEVNKMKIKNCTLFIVVLGLMIGCQPQKKGEGKLGQVELEEVLSIGSIDDDAIFMWSGVAADDDGNIYVTDMMDYSLKKFDPSGRLLKKAGGKGEGPGEFLAPLALSCSLERIYVKDQYEPGIMVFDKDLNFLRKIPSRRYISGFKAISDECIAVTYLSVLTKGSIYFINEAGQVLRKFNYMTKDKNVMMGQVNMEIDADNNVYLAYTFQDRIEKYDGEGNKIWTRNLLDRKKVEKKMVRGLNLPAQIIYKTIVQDSLGRLYVLGGGLSKNKGRDVYVLNQEGEHLTTFTLAEDSHLIYFDSRDNLYARANSGITLKKFKLHLKTI